MLQVLTSDNRTVERLYLGGNGINGKAAVLLGEMLEANSNLRALLLNVNFLGDEGAAALAKSLSQNRTLQELGLASNGITARGARPLLETVAAHPALRSLDLGYSVSTKVLGAFANTLGDEGAPIIAQMLRENNTLQRLNLCGNGFSETGKMQIVAAMEENRTLQHLVLDGRQNAQLKILLERNRQFAPQLPTSTSDVGMIRSVYRTARKKKPSTSETS